MQSGPGLRDPAPATPSGRGLELSQPRSQLTVVVAQLPVRLSESIEPARKPAAARR